MNKKSNMSELHRDPQLIRSDEEQKPSPDSSPRLGPTTRSRASQMPRHTRPKLLPVPAWAAAIGRLHAHGMSDLGGGPRPWKLSWVIDFQKTGTFPLLALLIAWYHNTSTAAWIYLAMHGSYGLVWMVKDLAFPDPAWQRRVPSPPACTRSSACSSGTGRSAGCSSRARRIRSTRYPNLLGSASASACACWAA